MLTVIEKYIRTSETVDRHGVLVGDAAIGPSLTVSVPHASIELRSEHHQHRLSASHSDLGSSYGASVTASCSKSSSVDTQSTQDSDCARPETLAECQQFIRRLEADSLKQASQVFIPAV